MLHVLPVPASTNASTRLTLLSIQGLVNRDGASLYLDTDNETGNASSMLAFLVAQYGVSTDVVTLDWVYAHYLAPSGGLVVFDPARPESVNIVTMVSALDGAAIAGPDTAPWLEARYGVRVRFDYASSNWTGFDSVSAYDRAVRELYPRMDPNLFAILPPDRLPLRDYLIATRTFVFYEPQGVLASPAQLAATQRMLAAAPRGVPVVGWFDSPTLTEENAFVQLASQYGKPVFGTQDVPNLSVLTAFGRNEVRAPPAPPPTPPLENKTYLVVAVPDGDNLDFIAHRMRELWAEPERGTFPIAWSLSPLLADLAPPYLDLFYRTATPDDRFVLGPSGAGYVYPDYLGPGDLAPFLASTARYANETGMDVAWLLNAFVASEIPYHPATLSAYVDALHPRGLVLDYDDQAKTQETWMQAGTTAAAPAIRSTQLWTTMDNLLAKVGAAMATWDRGPHFLWITVYTFRFDLADARTMVQELAARGGRPVDVVTPEQLFSLMEEDFVARARAQLAAAEADPFAAAFLAPQVDRARAWLDAPANQAPAWTAYDATLASSELRAAGLEEAGIALGVVVVAAALVALSSREGLRPNFARAGWTRGRPLIVLALAFALFLLVARTALAANFWSYQWLLVGVALAGFGRPLRRFLDRIIPRRGLVVVAGLSLAFDGLALGTNVAFPLAAIGTVAVVDSALSRESVESDGLIIAATVGGSLGFLVSADLVTFAVLASALAIAVLIRPMPPPAARGPSGKGALGRGLVFALPFVALVVASNFSLSLRLGILGTDLGVLAAALVALAPLAGVLASRRWITNRTQTVRLAALGLAAASLAAVGLAAGAVVEVVLLTAAVAGFAVAAVATLRRYAASGRDPAAVVSASLAWIPLLLVLFRMPPVVYSLTIVRLPETVEAVLYAPEYLFAAAAIVAAAEIVRRMVRSSRRGKGYPADTPQGGRGSR